MLISEIGIRGYKSFGNNEQVLKLNTENGELILLMGNNGNGKCVEKNTCIDIEINDIILTKELINWLETTERGSRFLLYIKETNNILYEKIKDFNRAEN